MSTKLILEHRVFARVYQSITGHLSEVEKIVREKFDGVVVMDDSRILHPIAFSSIEKVGNKGYVITYQNNIPHIVLICRRYEYELKDMLAGLGLVEMVKEDWFVQTFALIQIVTNIHTNILGV